MALHEIQQKILKLAQTQDLAKLSLREIGSFIGVAETQPQKIKHHLEQLRKKKLLSLVGERNFSSDKKGAGLASTAMLHVPILGKANCGEATLVAEEDLSGYLTVSKSLLKKNRNIFALEAVGDSMDRADIGGQPIKNGDFVIIDADNKVPMTGDYVVSVIGNVANIKRFYKDERNKRFVLVSESSKNYPPIFIHEEDMSEYFINGKVLQVIQGFQPTASR